MHPHLPRRRIARRMPLNTQMGLGHDRFDHALGGWASEYRIQRNNHRHFYRRWAQLIAAKGWADLPLQRRRVRDAQYPYPRKLPARGRAVPLPRSALLDERRFHEWLELFTDDIRYWMAIRTNRYPKHSKAISILDPAATSKTISAAEDELAILDEVEGDAHRRASRASIPAWPGPRTRRRAPGTSSPISRSNRAMSTTRLRVYSQLHRLPQPRRDRAGFLRRRPPGCAAPRRRRVEDRASQADPRPERAAGEERQHLFLNGGSP